MKVWITEKISKELCWTLALLGLFSGLALAGVSPVPKKVPLKPKNSSACDFVEGYNYSDVVGGCLEGAGSCYDCEFTNRNGTLHCWQAANPDEGDSCNGTEFQF